MIKQPSLLIQLFDLEISKNESNLIIKILDFYIRTSDQKNSNMFTLLFLLRKLVESGFNNIENPCEFLSNGNQIIHILQYLYLKYNFEYLYDIRSEFSNYVQKIVSIMIDYTDSNILNETLEFLFEIFIRNAKKIHFVTKYILYIVWEVLKQKVIINFIDKTFFKFSYITETRNEFMSKILIMRWFFSFLTESDVKEKNKYSNSKILNNYTNFITFVSSSFVRIFVSEEENVNCQRK